jgi:hypothetical protein
MSEKKTLSTEMLDEQMAVELPDRAMMALVNVTIVDLLNNNTVTVQLPIGVAANVCGVNANVLASQIHQPGGPTCTAFVNNPVG